ncbi:ATP synthase F0 subunit B [Pajaroellobacter abortibovis]|uniref:Uncharacterized protein n=1 Tax=Pajaroellobacter abortibovis TaxID=1882918 RepID=A0A1L6MZH3_9BACT|nr:ATP synthase F0 subunit B [Pajaroellobacter abortibovis]APS00943.1 hypothetical protein BCY86_06985 [Pajaroellobacter abortibovis]
MLLASLVQEDHVFSRGLYVFGSEGAVTIDLDLTFLGQMVLFLLLSAILDPLLFKPMLRLFEEREKQTEGAKKEARDLDEKAAAKIWHYEQAMQATRAAAEHEQNALRAESLKERDVILMQARKATAKFLEEGRRQATQEMEYAQKELVKVYPSLANDIVQRFLDRSVS